MQVFYYMGIVLYGLAVRIAALKSEKAQLWVRGRRNWKKNLASLPFKGDCVWVHCSSLGEFEQGRPVIESLKRTHPSVPILLTFFSPSGFEIRKNYPLADAVMYLPLDLPANAHFFVKTLQPKAVVFVKYDFWFFFLKALRKADIPHFLVSGIFRPSQYFFKSYGPWFVKGLKGFTSLFVQNEESKHLLSTIGVSAEVKGDTRFDRVVEVVKESKPLPMIEMFCEGAAFLGVMGSSWLAEERMLSERLKRAKEERWIIVPHEVDEAHLQQLDKLFPQSLRFSKVRSEDLREAEVLIIDQIGLLNRIYRYAHVAVIGGGFGKGVHNTLEAAAYGIPVFFGPNYERFQEIHELLALGAGQCFEDQKSFDQCLNRIKTDQNTCAVMGGKAQDYVHSKTGATAAVLQSLKPYIDEV